MRDPKFKQVIVLMLPKEKAAAEEMAEAMYGAKRHYLGQFIREAVAAKIEECRATLGICEYQAKATRR